MGSGHRFKELGTNRRTRHLPPLGHVRLRQRRRTRLVKNLHSSSLNSISCSCRRSLRHDGRGGPSALVQSARHDQMHHQDPRVQSGLGVQERRAASDGRLRHGRLQSAGLHFKAGFDSPAIIKTVNDVFTFLASELVITLIQMYEANYPEILKCCFIINGNRTYSPSKRSNLGEVFSAQRVCNRI